MWLSLHLGTLAGANIVAVFIIHWYVITTIGPGMETDALFAGLGVPQVVLVIISGSLTHVLVPLLAGEKEERFRKDAWGFFILVGGLFSIFTVVLYVLAPFWIPLLVPGFSKEGKVLTILLTRIQLGSVTFSALLGVLWAVYHAQKRFLWAEFAPLLGTIVSFGFLFWSLPRYGVEMAAWAMVLRMAVSTLLLLPSLGNYCQPDWTSATIKAAWQKLKPLLVGNAYYKTDPLVNNLLSSMAAAGRLSLLYFGLQLYGAANQIINKAFVVPMVPLLAVHAKEGEWQKYRCVYRRHLLWVTVLTGCGYLLFTIVGQHLLRLLVEYGSVTKHDVLLLWWILVAFVGVLIGGSMGSILATSFYAKGNTITPVKVGAINFSIGIVLKIVGFVKFGVIGIAMGMTVYYILDVLVMYLLLERELNVVISNRSLTPRDIVR